METGLLIVTEAMDPEGADLVAEYADIIQIGARNMQNYSLLKKVGRLTKPVLLKRGLSATIQELLLSAEYILAEGNPNVILCERGVRGFDSATRESLRPLGHPGGQGTRRICPSWPIRVTAPAIAIWSYPWRGPPSRPAPMASSSKSIRRRTGPCQMAPRASIPSSSSRMMQEVRAIAEAIGRRVAAPAEVRA